MKLHIAKRILCGMLAAVCSAGFLTAAPLAAASPAIIKGEIALNSAKSDEPVTEAYYYSDAYFDKPGSVQDLHLNTMSLALACAAETTEAATALLDKIGFANPVCADMEGNSADTVGTVIASKKIDGQDVVAVAIRGTNYGNEWIANLTAGSEGNISGFQTASDKVAERLKDYIESNALENVKIWMTGYSRGGAVADLTGCQLNEKPADFRTKTDDLYIYTFEAPNCSASDKVYDNIYRTRNRNDLITYLYPSVWGIHTNGKEIVTGGEKTIMGKTFDISFELKDKEEITAEAYLKELESFLGEALPRESYAGDCENSVGALIELFLSQPLDTWKGVLGKVKEKASGLQENPRFILLLVADLMSGISKHNSDKMYQVLSEDLKEILNEMMLTERDRILYAKELKTVEDNLYPVLRAAGPALVKDFMYTRTIDYSKDMPEGYDDPDYDPYEDPLYLEVLKVIEAQEQQQENGTDEETQEQEKTDAEKGEFDGGNDDAYSAGADDARNGAERRTEPVLPENPEQYSDEYLEAYGEAWLSWYNEGYEDALNELNKSDEDKGYDAGSLGWDAGFADGQLGQNAYKASYHYEPPVAEEGVTYSEEYLTAYEQAYNDTYEDGFNTGMDEYNNLTLWHFSTLIGNLQDLIEEHTVEKNYQLVKALDSYYTTDPTTVPEEPAETDQPEKTEPAKQIADDETLLQWAAVDYLIKNDALSSAEIVSKEDGKLTIRLNGESGEAADTYVIDTETGKGTDEAGNEVNLPQTGTGGTSAYLNLVGALLLAGGGTWAVRRSGIARRRKEEQE